MKKSTLFIALIVILVAAMSFTKTSATKSNKSGVEANSAAAEQDFIKDPKAQF